MRVFPVPPIVQEECEQLFGNCLLASQVERVQFFPFPTGIWTLSEFLDEPKNGHCAVEMILAFICRRTPVTVEEYLPMLPHRHTRCGSRCLIRLLSKGVY